LYSLHLQSWSLSSYMCLGSGIDMFLTSKRASLVVKPKSYYELPETWLNEIVRNITAYVLLSSKLGLMAFGPTIQVWTVQKELSSHERETREPSRELGRIGPQKVCRWSCFCCASLISNRENPQAPSSGIWTYRSGGVRNSPMNGVVNAKWRAGTSTRVSINLNQKSMYWKSCHEHRHTGVGIEIVSDIKQGTCMV